MFLAPDGDEIEIANAAAGFLGETMPLDRLHPDPVAPSGQDMDANLRHSLGEMGWFAITLPEAQGGSGLSPIEHALFFREVGRLCGPVDVLAQTLAGFVVQDDTLRNAILSGAQGVALAIEDRGRMRLIGSASASHALAVDRQGAELHLISDGAEPRPALDPANSMRLIDTLRSPVAQWRGETAWQLGELGVAAMLIGIAEASLAMIVEYAKVRETFGRKIGAYQAVRHPCADMALRAEAARCQLWFAAAALKEGRTDAGVHLDAAKHLANQAAVANSDSNIQLHGGIGVTDEHNAHLMLKHALMLGKLFGSKRAVLSRLLDARVES